MRLSQPLGYLVPFILWFALVVGGTGLALGLGLKDAMTAVSLLGWGVLLGAGTFLVVSLVMGTVGFEIGGSHPPRPTMLPVTFLAAWTTALSGSTVFGRVLAKSRLASGTTPSVDEADSSTA